MSGTKPSPNMGRNTVDRKQQQKIHKGCALTRMYLLSRAVVPATPSTGPRIWESIKLPSLTDMEHQKTPGITELALFIPGQKSVSKTFSHKLCTSSQKRISSLPGVRADKPLLACKPVYTHFSLPLRPLPRLNHVTSPARSLNISQCGLRPLVKKPHGCQENLSIKGIPCFSRALTTKGRKQLHVFLPTEGTVEEDEKDSESIDEGFMDEVDHKAAFKQQN